MKSQNENVKKGFEDSSATKDKNFNASSKQGPLQGSTSSSASSSTAQGTSSKRAPDVERDQIQKNSATDLNKGQRR